MKEKKLEMVRIEKERISSQPCVLWGSLAARVACWIRSQCSSGRRNFSKLFTGALAVGLSVVIASTLSHCKLLRFQKFSASVRIISIFRTTTLTPGPIWTGTCRWPSACVPRNLTDTHLQTQHEGAAGAAEAHGAETDERIHERMIAPGFRPP